MCIYLHNATPRLGDCFLSCHPFTYILLVEGMIPPLLIYTWTVNWLEVGSMPCMVISTEVCNLVILSSHEKDPFYFFFAVGALALLLWDHRTLLTSVGRFCSNC